MSVLTQNEIFKLKKYAQKLTCSQIEAINRYSLDSATLNRWLLRRTPNPEYEQWALTIQSAITNAPTLNHPVKIFNLSRPHYLINGQCIQDIPTKDIYQNRQFISGVYSEDILPYLWVFGGNKPNKPCHTDTYCCVIEYILPAGFPLLLIDDISVYPYQKEILLPFGLELQLSAKGTKNLVWAVGDISVCMEYLPRKETSEEITKCIDRLDPTHRELIQSISSPEEGKLVCGKKGREEKTVGLKMLVYPNTVKDPLELFDEILVDLGVPEEWDVIEYKETGDKDDPRFQNYKKIYEGQGLKIGYGKMEVEKDLSPRWQRLESQTFTIISKSILIDSDSKLAMEIAQTNNQAEILKNYIQSPTLFSGYILRIPLKLTAEMPSTQLEMEIRELQQLSPVKLKTLNRYYLGGTKVNIQRLAQKILDDFSLHLD